MQKTEVIPFGKYKGQPIEVLLNDKPYLDWLQQQDWFRNRYGTINTLIINNFQEPTETPEHNKIQALFTDDDFCKKFISLLIDKKLCRDKKGFKFVTYTNPVNGNIYFHGDANIFSTSGGYSLYNGETYKHTPLNKKELELSINETRISYNIAYEFNGVDVCMNIFEEPIDELYKKNDFRTLAEVNIEIKPSVSDDFPAILRQMNNNKSKVLLTERYTGTGATLEQVKKIFAASDKNIILLEEVT